jgi:uncharacterized protein (DUF433 family)
MMKGGDSSAPRPFRRRAAQGGRAAWGETRIGRLRTGKGETGGFEFVALEGKMTREELLSRITINPNVCFGKPCIRGHRIWVSLVLDFLASGMSVKEILKEYPGLTREDVLACIAYGAEMARERYFEPPQPSPPSKPPTEPPASPPAKKRRIYQGPVEF